MVKGCQKTVIFLKNTESDFFEEAYFVLTDDLYDYSDGDLIAEANRIIENVGEARMKKRAFRKEKLIFFLIGFITSLALSTVLYVLL